MSAAAKSGHPTSAMSAADLLAVLVDGYLRYDFAEPKSPANDRLVFSKGHASTLLYAIYRAAGVVSDEEILEYRKLGSPLEGHPTPRHPVGRRRDRVARPGPADRRRDGARREVPRADPEPRLGALRRQRDGRGIDVGGIRARRALRARQPDRDHRREPARPARRDDGRLGSRRRTSSAPRPSGGTRSWSTATTSRRSTGVRRGGRDQRASPPLSSPAR